MTVCPSCKGSKAVTTLLRYGGSAVHSLQAVPCPRCGGSGRCTEEYARQILAGRRLRAMRVMSGQYESLAEAAYRFGVSRSELSSWEVGARPVPSWITDRYRVAYVIRRDDPIPARRNYYRWGASA